MFGKIDSRLKPYINDYKLNLITKWLPSVRTGGSRHTGQAALAADVLFYQEYDKIETALRLFSVEERSIQMGKDLRGKELGAGLHQRKDGNDMQKLTAAGF